MMVVRRADLSLTLPQVSQQSLDKVIVDDFPEGVERAGDDVMVIFKRRLCDKKATQVMAAALPTRGISGQRMMARWFCQRACSGVT